MEHSEFKDNLRSADGDVDALIDLEATLLGEIDEIQEQIESVQYHRRKIKDE